MKTKLSSPTKILKAYIITALWSETGDNCEPLDDNYSIKNIPQATLDTMAAELAAFLIEATPYINGDYDGAVHDFWLTRNGHGAGFWDGDWTHGDTLTTIAHKYRECHLYTNRGWIYCY